MRIPAPGARRSAVAAAARRTALTVSAGVCVVAFAACGSGPPPAQEAEADASVALSLPDGAEPAAGGPTREDSLFAVLVDAGVPVEPAETTLQIALGICDRLSAGADESEVTRNVMPVAEYKAATTDGALSPGQVSDLLIRAAREVYCPA